MASAYLPAWLHAPSLSLDTVKSTLSKRVPVGYATFVALGVFSTAYILQDIISYYFFVSYETRGHLSSNPFLYLLSGLVRSYRFFFHMDGTNARPIYRFVERTKVGLYRRKFLREGELPVRRGPRPGVLIQGFPHRQIPQILDPKLNAAVEAHLHSLASSHPTTLSIGPSRVEPHALALFLTPPPPPSSHPDLSPFNQIGISSLEFAHNHSSENSLHLILSPLDCAEAVEKGWAVRFPVAGCGQAGGRCLVYAPRDEGEVEYVKLLVDKAYEWMMARA